MSKKEELKDNLLSAFYLKKHWDQFPPNYDAKYLAVSGLERWLKHKITVTKKAKIKPVDQESGLVEYTRQVREFTYSEMLEEIQLALKDGCVQPNSEEEK